MANAYVGTFVAKDGRTVNMMFVRPVEMPPAFTQARVKGTGKSPVLPDGMELVWSVSHDGWRVFNHSTGSCHPAVEFRPEHYDNVRHGHHSAIELDLSARRHFRPDLVEGDMAVI